MKNNKQSWMYGLVIVAVLLGVGSLVYLQHPQLQATSVSGQLDQAELEEDSAPEMYKWQDEQGRWVYSNKAPEKGDFEVVDTGKNPVEFKSNPTGVEPVSNRRLIERLSKVAEEGYATLSGNEESAQQTSYEVDYAGWPRQEEGQTGLVGDSTASVHIISGDDNQDVGQKLQALNELLSIETLNRDLAEKNRKIRESQSQNLPQQYRQEYNELKEKMEKRNQLLTQ